MLPLGIQTGCWSTLYHEELKNCLLPCRTREQVPSDPPPHRQPARGAELRSGMHPSAGPKPQDPVNVPGADGVLGATEQSAQCSVVLHPARPGETREIKAVLGRFLLLLTHRLQAGPNPSAHCDPAAGTRHWQEAAPLPQQMAAPSSPLHAPLALPLQAWLRDLLPASPPLPPQGCHQWPGSCSLPMLQTSRRAGSVPARPGADNAVVTVMTMCLCPASVPLRTPGVLLAVYPTRTLPTMEMSSMERRQWRRHRRCKRKGHGAAGMERLEMPRVQCMWVPQAG